MGRNWSTPAIFKKVEFSLLGKALLAGLFLISLLGVLGLLYINTDKTKNIILKKVYRRTGLITEYERIIPVRLDKIRLSKVSLFKDRSVQIEQIYVDIDLKKLIFNKQLELQGVRIDSPTVAVSLEEKITSLKELIKKMREAQRNAEEATKLAQQNKKAPQKASPPLPKKKKTTDQKSKIKKKTPVKPKPETSLPRIQVSNCTIKLKSSTFPSYNSQIKGISISTNPNLKNREGKIKVQSLQIGNKSYQTDVETSFSYKHDKLDFPAKTHELANGIKVTTQGRLRPNSFGIFGLQLGIDIPDRLEFKHPYFPGLHLSLGSEKINFQAKGALANPATIKAQFITEAKDLSLTHVKRGGFTFPAGLVKMELNNGKLSVPQLKLQSDEISVLSNGTVAITGEVHAVTRFVMSPHWKKHARHLANGLRIRHRGKLFPPLETQDRFYQDVEFKTIGNEMKFKIVQVDKDWRSLDRFIGYARQFVFQELREDN